MTFEEKMNTGPFECMYSDVFGLVKTQPWSRTRYFLILLDSDRSYSFVPFILRRCEAADAVREMVKDTENPFNMGVRKMTSANRNNVNWSWYDGGGE